MTNAEADELAKWFFGATLVQEHPGIVTFIPGPTRFARVPIPVIHAWQSPVPSLGPMNESDLEWCSILETEGDEWI